MVGVDPDDRRRALLNAITTARRTDDRLVFAAGPKDRTVRVAYEDGRLRLEFDEERDRPRGSTRDALDDLLEAYRVFKVAQPETRRADDGVVYLSAVTDAKHTADFVEALFREVFEEDEDYELRVR